MMVGRPSFWSKVTFQGRTVELQVGMLQKEAFIPNHQAVIKGRGNHPKKNGTFGLSSGMFRKAPGLDSLLWAGDLLADRRWPIHYPHENPLYSPRILT